MAKLPLVLLLLLLGFLSTFLPLALGQKFKCTAASEKEMDDLVARIMTFGRSDRKFPVNKSELKEYCKYGRLCGWECCSSIL